MTDPRLGTGIFNKLITEHEPAVTMSESVAI